MHSRRSTAASCSRGQRAKLGLRAAKGPTTPPTPRWPTTGSTLLHAGARDFTLAWRRLADAAAGDEAPLRAVFADPARHRTHGSRAGASAARARTKVRRGRATPRPRVPRACAASIPCVIPRNQRVEEALAAASGRRRPRTVRPLARGPASPVRRDAPNAGYAEPAPADVTACYQTFCGT